MSLVPEEHRCTKLNFHFAPLVDFLFIIIAVFALLITTQKRLYRSQVNLIRHEVPNGKMPADAHNHVFNLGISASGQYQWLDPATTQTFETIHMLKRALFEQINRGVLPSDPRKHHIFLHIDRNAQWSVIGTLLLALHQEGFIICPIYEKKGKDFFTSVDTPS